MQEKIINIPNNKKILDHELNQIKKKFNVVCCTGFYSKLIIKCTLEHDNNINVVSYCFKHEQYYSKFNKELRALTS